MAIFRQTNFTPKQQQAIRLRDAMLARLRNEGVFERSSAFPHLAWYGEKFQASLRTPFQKLPPVKERLRYVAALSGASCVNLPYGLDIWLQGKGKVLNVEWDLNGSIAFVCFHRGAWEEEILQGDIQRPYAVRAEVESITTCQMCPQGHAREGDL